MLYRTTLAILSGGLIAIETVTVSAPLLMVNPTVNGREAMPWHAADQAVQESDEATPRTGEILGISCAAVTGTASLVHLVLAATSLVRRRFVDGDGFNDTFPTAAGA